jgi:hypothetical protein
VANQFMKCAISLGTFILDLDNAIADVPTGIRIVHGTHFWGHHRRSSLRCRNFRWRRESSELSSGKSYKGRRLVEKEVGAED